LSDDRGVGTQALWIAALGGLGVGSIVSWWWTRAQLAVAARREELLAQDRDALAKSAKRLGQEMAEMCRSASSAIAQVQSDAELTLGRRSSADDALVEKLEAAVATRDEGRRDQGEAAVEAVESAAADIDGRRHALDDAIAELERGTRELAEGLDMAGVRDRMAVSRVDELLSATDTTVTTAAAMNDVIKRLQDSAAETQDLSAQVSQEAERGYRAVHRTLDEIERIRELTGVVRARIEALGARVSDIGHVVKVIQEITEKTNLLALNASIIAAQAGERGRSFSVVAQEIKALAHRTAASTKEISEQIRNVQTESERAAAAMIDGVTAVGEGFQVAIAAGDALDAIRQSARKAQKRVQSTTRSLRRQHTAVNEVVESAASVAQLANGFASVVRGQSGTAEALRVGAVDTQAAARRIAELLREYSGQERDRVATFTEIAEQMVALSRRDQELRKRVDAVRGDTARARGLTDDLAAQWSAVSAATARLCHKVEQLAVD
jgi:methyl-accepting chemotaxis protein